MSKENTILGISDFDELIKKDLAVDKTLFIKEFVNCGAKVCTILRPPGFGKSINLTMLKSFLSIGADPSKFARFEIGKPEHNSFVDKHYGKYPVVYLTFKDCKGNTWKEMSCEIIKALKQMLLNHSEDLSRHDPCNLKRLQSNSTKINEFTSVLFDLTETLEELYKVDVFVLIDEYDTPLFHACRMGFYDDTENFFVSFFSDGSKDNPNLEKGCLMGVFKFIPVNNFTFNCVADKKFSSSFGFTRDEVLKILNSENAKSNSDTNDAEDLDNLLEWYNGYAMGSSNSVINPWLFVSWLEGSKEFKSYWVDDPSTETLSSFLKLCIPSRLDDISNLLLGDKPVYCFSLSSPIRPTEFFQPRHILKHLVLNGYLTHKPSSDDTVELYIPNKELKMQWKKEFIKVLTRTIDCSGIRQELELSLPMGPIDIDGLEEFLRKYFVPLLSHFDFKNENNYRLALLSFLRVLMLDDDNVVFYTNEEWKHGILFEIRSIKRVVCIELNNTTKPKSLKANAVTALQQIKDNNYTANYGHCECILIGVSFSGKLMSKPVSEIVSHAKKQRVEKKRRLLGK